MKSENRKKGMFNASYEESKNLVDQQMIDKLKKEATYKSNENKLNGVIVSSIIVSLATVLLQHLDNQYDDIITVGFFLNFCYLVVLVTLLYYIFIFIKNEKKPIFHFFYFTKAMIILVSLLF